MHGGYGICYKIRNPNIRLLNKFYRTGSSPTNDENYPGLSSPSTGEDRGGGGILYPPHPHPLPPGEREIIE
jgi:hypothetical protein